jgi:hypothetical protein
MSSKTRRDVLPQLPRVPVISREKTRPGVVPDRRAERPNDTKGAALVVWDKGI